MFRSLSVGLKSVVMASVGLLITGGVDLAQGACPNQRATQVDARTYWTGEVERCGIGIRILGIGGSIFGPRCGERKVFEPAHQVCRGEDNPGTACLPSRTIELQTEECHCADKTVLGTGILLPSCECSPGGVGGTVEDFSTVPCAVLGDPRVEPWDWR